MFNIDVEEIDGAGKRCASKPAAWPARPMAPCSQLYGETTVLATAVAARRKSPGSISSR